MIISMPNILIYGPTLVTSSKEDLLRPADGVDCCLDDDGPAVTPQRRERVGAYPSAIFLFLSAFRFSLPVC